MELVIDANILFASLIKNGKTSELLSREDFELFTPEFILAEFSKYKEFLLKKTNRNEKDFQKYLNFLGRQIKIFPLSEIKPYIKEAIKISPDPKDVPYLALALLLNISIWSNDKRLKEQTIIKVFSTDDLIKYING